MSSDADSIRSRGSTDSDSVKSQSSTESDSPAQKKAKIDDEEEDCKAEPKIRIFLEPTNDPECRRQRELLSKQFEDSEGFDVDWETCDYSFDVKNFDWVGPLGTRWSNDELMEALIEKAIEEHDDEYGTKLAFGKYVSANLVPVKGLIYYITFSANDLNSPNQDPKLYQAKVWKFADEISVLMVRPRSTPELPYTMRLTHQIKFADGGGFTCQGLQNL